MPTVLSVVMERPELVCPGRSVEPTPWRGGMSGLWHLICNQADRLAPVSGVRIPSPPRGCGEIHEPNSGVYHSESQKATVSFAISLAPRFWQPAPILQRYKRPDTLRDLVPLVSPAELRGVSDLYHWDFGPVWQFHHPRTEDNLLHSRIPLGTGDDANAAAKTAGEILKLRAAEYNDLRLNPANNPREEGLGLIHGGCHRHAV